MAVDNKIIIDKKDGVFEVLSSSTFPSADVSQTVDGIVKLEIDTGTGYSTIYDNTDFLNPNYTIPIDGAGTVGAITNDILIALIKDVNGVVIKGTYRFTFTEQFLVATVATTQTAAITFNYTSDVVVKSCLSSSVDCSIPKIAVADSQTFVVSGITPTFETSTLTLEYPETSEQPSLVVEAVPFSLSTKNVWTKGYSAYSNVIALYDFTSYLERVQVLAEIDFTVNCAKLCAIYDCIASFKNEMDANKAVNGTLYNKMKADYEYIMSLGTQVLISQSCGKDATSLINEITTIINANPCQTSCCTDCGGSDVSTKVYGSMNDPLALEYAYVGVGIIPTNSAEVLGLTKKIIENGQVKLETGTVENIFTICLPPTKTIFNVIDITNYGANLTSQYILQSPTVPVVIDGIAYNFNVYSMTQAVPYTDNAIHLATIND